MPTKMKLATVTPADCEKYIESTGKNRRVNKRHVHFLAEQLTHKLWEINGDCLRFNVNGEFIDGQHRCYACIEAGIPFKTWVCTGLSVNSWNTIDNGRARSLGDILSSEGVVNSTATASATRYLWCLGDWKRSKTRLSNREGLSLLEKNPGLSSSVQYIKKMGCDKLAPSGVCAAIHYKGRKRYAKPTDRFFEQLGMGDKMTVTQPVYHLRNHFLNMRAKQLVWHRDNMARMIFKAYQLAMKNQRIKSLELEDEDPQPRM